MNNLKWVNVITFLLGVIFLIYGWLQSWDFSAHTSEFETVLIHRTVRSYVFIISGIILLLNGVALEMIRKYLDGLENEIYDIEIKYKKGK